MAKRLPYDGRGSHPLYSRYKAMVYRCYNPANKSYANYGGRGIVVCQEWLNDFWAYARDVGEPPDKSGHWTIDRVDNDGPYAPTNVRWATYGDNLRNRREYDPDARPRVDRGRTRLLNREQRWAVVMCAYYGKSAPEIGSHFGVSAQAIRKLINGEYSIV
jgi:hypothetical protein